jgi:lysophospholipase L1-like esterase
MYTIYFSLMMAFSCIVRGEKSSQLIQNLDNGVSQTLVFYGTSLTAGGSWADEMEKILNEKYGKLIQVYNCARGGSNSGWGRANILKRVLPLDPDTILIEFSMNDAIVSRKIPVDRARENLLYMIATLKAQNPKVEVVLLTMNPLGDKVASRTADDPYFRGSLPDHYQMVRDFAAEQKLKLIDVNSIWLEFKNKDPRAFAKRVPDGVHPDDIGNREVILPAVLEGLGLSQ